MSLKDQISKLTLDPGCRALAEAVDALTARLDLCCGPEGARAAARPPLASTAKTAPTAPQSGESSKD